MRFIIMHKTNTYWEAGGRPDPALVARVGAMIEEIAKSGALVSGEGLRPSSEGVRLRFAGGVPTRTAGPFEGANELPASFSIIRAANIDEAVAWATRQAEILGDGEFDIRPVTEEWDIGVEPPPAEITSRRYMILRKATAASEAGREPSAEQRSRLAQLIEEAAQDGSHLAGETLRPSAKGRRYTNSKDGVTYFDGPFLETKELLGGYAIVLADSLAGACQLAERYIEAVGASEVDVRELD